MKSLREIKAILLGCFYIGTFGEDVFFTGIDDYVGCEFDITMIYEAKDMEGNFIIPMLIFS